MQGLFAHAGVGAGVQAFESGFNVGTMAYRIGLGWGSTLGLSAPEGEERYGGAALDLGAMGQSTLVDENVRRIGGP